MKKFLCKWLRCCPDQTPMELAWAKLRARVAPKFRIYLTERFNTNPETHVFEVVIDLNNGTLISSRKETLEKAVWSALYDFAIR